jgi:hypothetical protein
MSIDIPFDEKWQNIAIAMSGGADSTILAYLLCSKVAINKKFTIHVINNIRCWKTKPWQQYDVKGVLEWLENRFNHITFKVHTNFVPPEMEHAYGTFIVDEYNRKVSGDTIELRSFSEFVCYSENVDAYFNGVTKNPTNVNFSGLVARDIESTDKNKHLEAMIHMGKLVYHPFRFIDKKRIILQYKLLKIDNLLNLTRSCEGEFDDITYKTYTPGQYVPLCGECFWCKEREWAIEYTV